MHFVSGAKFPIPIWYVVHVTANHLKWPYIKKCLLCGPFRVFCDEQGNARDIKIHPC